MKPVIAIDWDGTCVENVWPAMGDWLPGAPEALRELADHFRVLIHTARIAPVMPDYATPIPPGKVQEEINAIRAMLDDAGLNHVEIHTGPYKPGAVAYVDDKAIRFTGRSTSWRNLMPRLRALAAVEERR